MNVSDLADINKLDGERQKLALALKQLNDKRDTDELRIGVLKGDSLYDPNFYVTLYLSKSIIIGHIQSRLQVVEAELRGYGVQS